MQKMDSDYIEREGIAGKYRQGRLTPEQMVEFETYLMDHPEMVESLELDDLLTKAMPQTLTAPLPAAHSRFWWWLLRPWGASLATLVVCLVCFPFAADWLTKEGNGAGTDAAAINLQNIYLSPARGGSDSSRMAVVEPGENDRFFELTIQPENLSATRFDIDIRRESDGKVVFDKRRVTVMSSGDIRLLLPVKTYVQGHYVLSATAVAEKAEPEQFYFGVRRR